MSALGTVQIPDRVLPRVFDNVVMGKGCCWISAYSVGSHGYAQIGWWEGDRSRMVTAHRAAWTATHGPIPDGLTVDHACRVRRCVNPAHLRLLTNEQNATDNGSASRRTNPDSGRLCHKGHPLALQPNGRSYCRTCSAERKRLRKKVV